MYLLTDGSCVGDIAGTPISLRAGSFLWMQPGQRHTFALGQSSAPMTLYFMRYRLHSPRGELALDGRTFQQWEAAWDLRDLVDQFVDELGTKLPHRSLRLRALLLCICTSALRRGESSSTQSGPGNLGRAQRQTLESYVRQNPAARPTPAELAGLMHLSHDYFSRLFAQTFGQSPRTWLVQQRVRRAARMLADSLQSVSEIATTLGYQDASAFSHQFTRWQGVSPRTYRQQQR